MQLSDEIFTEVTKLCASADELVKLERLDEAKANYIEALKLLPADRNEWEAATWIYVSIGDIHFKKESFDKCFKCFFNAVQCPTGLGNPYIHLRLGQMYFEAENFEKAADELTRAYVGGGLDILLEDNPKYLDFLESKIEI